MQRISSSDAAAAASTRSISAVGRVEKERGGGGGRSSNQPVLLLLSRGSAQDAARQPSRSRSVNDPQAGERERWKGDPALPASLRPPHSDSSSQAPFGRLRVVYARCRLVTPYAAPDQQLMFPFPFHPSIARRRRAAGGRRLVENFPAEAQPWGRRWARRRRWSPGVFGCWSIMTRKPSPAGMVDGLD